MNKYSFEGDSFFMLKAAQDCTINGIKYVKGQPITYFEHCKPVLYYTKKDVNGKVSVNNLINYTETLPQTLVIGGIAKQQSISNLIFNKNYDTIYTEEKVEEGTVDENGKIYLTCAEEVAISNLFILDENGNNIKTFQLFKNILIGSSAFEGKTFKIFYTITHDKAPLDSYNCTTTKIPYVYGCVVTKGKINGIDGKMVIEFPKLSCSSTPTLNFWGDEMFNSQLEFTCINTDKEPVRINYIYG